MRTLSLIALAACSNAAQPGPDAAFLPVDAPANARTVVLNEIAASETPDWFEIVNATTSPIELSDFIYVDAREDFARAATFPAMTLAPGAYYVQDVDDTISGFKLGSDEELWVYRASDHALSDGVDWEAGASPAGQSYARSPSIFGPFVTGAQTKGVSNP